METELSKVEARNLSTHEAVIERGKTAFIEVGNALAAIRDGRLYRVEFKTFEDYTMGRWGWNQRNASYYIGAANVAQELGTQVPNLDYSQARELSRLASPAPDGDKRRKVINFEAVQEVAAKIDFSTATVKDVARAVDVKLAEQRNQSVTYKNQPAIDATRGAVPLAGNSHVYTVSKLLWPEDVETMLADLLIGDSLHLCGQLVDVKISPQAERTGNLSVSAIPWQHYPDDMLLVTNIAGQWLGEYKANIRQPNGRPLTPTHHSRHPYLRNTCF